MDSSATDLPREKDLILGSDRPQTYAGDGPNVWSPSSPLSTISRLVGLEKDFAPVTGVDALRQAAVMACLDVMAQDTARAPLTLTKVISQGRRRRGYEVVPARGHPLAKLFWVRPNRFMTWSEFTTMIVYHLGLLNQAYVIPVRNRLLQVVELIPVLPARVTMDVDTSTGRIFYRVQAGNLAEAAMYGGEDELIFFPEEIIHIKTRSLNGFQGIPTIGVGNRVLSLTQAVLRFQDRLFRRDGTMRGVFQTSENNLSQEQYDRLKESLKEALGMLRDLGYPLVLEGGMEFKSISMNAKDAETKEAYAQQISETARLFRIPPHKVMHFDGVKYDNLDPLERQYVTDSLLPRCQAIEERLTLGLLNEDEQLDYFIYFDRDELHQSDPKALSERVLKQWDSGLITQNQALERLGYNPAANGDVYKMPANTFLIDQNHELVVSNQPSPGTPSGEAEGAAEDDTKPAETDNGEQS